MQAYHQSVLVIWFLVARVFMTISPESYLLLSCVLLVQSLEQTTPFISVRDVIGQPVDREAFLASVLFQLERLVSLPFSKVVQHFIVCSVYLHVFL